MKGKIGITIKISLCSALAASLFQASPVQAQEENSRLLKRSQPTLANLESRSLSDDAEVFFPKAQSETPIYPQGTVGRRSQAVSAFDFVGQEFQVKMGETTNADPDFDTFAKNEANSDKVRVLIEVLQWNN